MASKYVPLPDDQSSNSATESDGLMYEGYPSPSPLSKTSWRARWCIVIGGFLIFTAYSALLLAVPRVSCKKEPSGGIWMIDSPLKPYMEYEPTFFGSSEASKDYKLVGQPSDELDAAWHNIMQYFYAEIPVELMEKLGRTKQGIRLPNGNYPANYAFIHQLHCLKRLHQSYFPDRYYPNMTQEEQELQIEHNLHCLQMLVEAVMCKADEAPLTNVLVRRERAPGRQPDGRAPVRGLGAAGRAGLDGVKVGPFAPGLLVHPRYGPVVPGGRGATLDNRIGYVRHATPLDRERWP